MSETTAEDIRRYCLCAAVFYAAGMPTLGAVTLAIMAGGVVWDWSEGVDR